MDVRIYSIKELSHYVKRLFDSDVELKNITIRGELSNFKHHSSGHFYFTLKEEDAAIDGVMFASRAKLINFKPTNGMKIIIQGYVSAYTVRGTYQIYAQNMKPDGAGDIYARYEQLKKDLEKRGYFSPDRKKQLPKFPKKVGVLTSPTGAAVQDIINTINRRFPLSDIVLYPTLVQGIGAKENITENIERANKEGMCDCLIVGRGGGSIEDLWAFNEEMVAEAIYHSTIPIISAVGHETDFTIADFVADVRAATPTAAAELAVPDRFELKRQLQNVNRHMETLVNKKLTFFDQHLHRLENAYVMQYPERLLDKRILKLDAVLNKLHRVSPNEQVKLKETQLTHLEDKIQSLFKQVLSTQEERFKRNVHAMDLSSPLLIMKKGYSITKNKGNVVRSIQDVKENDYLDIQLQDGVVTTEVQSIKGDNPWKNHSNNS